MNGTSYKGDTISWIADLGQPCKGRFLLFIKNWLDKILQIQILRVTNILSRILMLEIMNAPKTTFYLLIPMLLLCFRDKKTIGRLGKTL